MLRLLYPNQRGLNILITNLRLLVVYSSLADVTLRLAHMPDHLVHILGVGYNLIIRRYFNFDKWSPHLVLIAVLF